VEEGPAFARRPELLQRVWNRLATGSVLLYGEWRMGKTTLLRQVEREAPAEYVPVFVSLQACEEGRFFRFLAGQTASALREELGEVGPELKVDAAEDLPAHDYAHSDLPRLLRWLQERRGRNARVLWLLDEMDLLNTYPLTVQNQFRGLLQSYPTELRVLAAGRQPHRPTTPSPTSSPWYNMFEMVEVPPWTEQEARGLLQSAVRGRYTWEEDALAFLVRTAQGVPYLLQLLARGALERTRSADRTRITLDDVREAFQTEFFAADPAVWQPVWAALPEVVQAALRATAAGEPPALDDETRAQLDAAGFLRAGEITVPRPLAEWLQEGSRFTTGREGRQVFPATS
jgi:hypothetical protein